MGQEADIQVGLGHAAAVIDDTYLLYAAAGQVDRDLAGSRVYSVVQKLPHHT